MYEVLGEINSRTFRVLWMLEELGESYEWKKEHAHSDLIRRHNPSGKLPVLLVDGTALTDSTAIITYLADKHGRFTMPAGTLERARQDGLTHLVLDEIDAVLWVAARHTFVLPEERRLPEIKDSLRWEFTRNLDRLMERLEGPYLMGAEMTVPDIILAHCGAWAKAAKFPAENERFRDYLRNLRSRDAFRRLTAG
ncbi:glutathione S-transferase [Aquicoccus sp. SCR17]|nr:glutathione S-transferase [Carideicomes alvinocaridis]